MTDCPSLELARQLCSRRGVRLTAQRETVLRLVCESQRPLSAYEILDRMRKGGRRPAPPTVYRALDFLLEQGLIHKLQSLHAFVACPHPHDPHAGHFMICTDCGQVDEISEAPLEKALAREARRIGFQPRRQVVELLGRCARCRSDHE